MDRYTSITQRRPHTAIKTMSSCLCVFFLVSTKRNANKTRYFMDFFLHGTVCKIYRFANFKLNMVFSHSSSMNKIKYGIKL